MKGSWSFSYLGQDSVGDGSEAVNVHQRSAFNAELGAKPPPHPNPFLFQRPGSIQWPVLVEWPGPSRRAADRAGADVTPNLGAFAANKINVWRADHINDSQAEVTTASRMVSSLTDETQLQQILLELCDFVAGPV